MIGLEVLNKGIEEERVWMEVLNMAIEIFGVAFRREFQIGFFMGSGSGKSFKVAGMLEEILYFTWEQWWSRVGAITPPLKFPKKIKCFVMT